jgi:hypothetical protein
LCISNVAWGENGKLKSILNRVGTDFIGFKQVFPNSTLKTGERLMLQQLTISVESIAPQNGTTIAPFWFGFHNGGFDTFDQGRSASAGLESLAEDGATHILH